MLLKKYRSCKTKPPNLPKQRFTASQHMSVSDKNQNVYRLDIEDIASEALQSEKSITPIIQYSVELPEVLAFWLTAQSLFLEQEL